MEPSVSALLLAAGRSERMGRCKQLLPLPDRPAVVRCAETILAAGITRLVVVVGEGEAVTRAVAGLPVTVVRNEAAQSDMAGSIRTGLAVLGRDSGNVFVCLCDHPLVTADTMIAMRGYSAGKADSIVIPCYKGRKGHPVLLPLAFLREIETLPTLRDVIGRHHDRVSLFQTGDEGTILDMDTWRDYHAILGRSRSVTADSQGT